MKKDPLLDDSLEKFLDEMLSVAEFKRTLYTHELEIRRINSYTRGTTQHDKDLIAVKQDGHTLRYVKNQTLEMCLAAVKQNGGALKYVKNQTFGLLKTLNFEPPTVANLNQKVYQAALRGLNMASWHSDCGTTHCWAGHIVNLAGEESGLLEQKWGTATLAHAIAIKSGVPITPEWFKGSLSEKDILAEMKRRMKNV